MPQQKVYLSKSEKPEKKYKVIIDKEGKNKTIHFGATGYTDYTKHKDPNHKLVYIDRHKKRENWNKSGIETAGFWSRWILWNEPTLKDSISKTEKKFNIKIIKK